MPNVQKGQAVLLLDSGTSYAYAPEAMVTAMYKNVPGATFDAGAGMLKFAVSICATEA